MSMPGGVPTHHGNFYCSLPIGVRAHHGLLRARAFETPATFHIVAKSLWTVQWFIQTNQKTIPSPLLINIAVTPSIILQNTQGSLLSEFARIKFHWNCSIYCMTHWEKLILISGCYDNHCENWFCDSPWKWGPDTSQQVWPNMSKWG